MTQNLPPVALLRFLFLVVTMIGAGAEPAAAVIYGEDDRWDVSDPILAGTPVPDKARATALLVNRQQLRSTVDFRGGPAFDVEGVRLRERFALCEPDRFQEQFAPGFCSSFLVTPTTLVTAGHCVPTVSACQSTAVAFGFTAASALAKSRQIPAEDLYYCQEVIAQRIDPSAGLDYAVIRLDRPVKDRAPLSLRQGPDIARGEPVAALAYPHGAPAKVIAGARVRSQNPSKAFFVANIDGFTGNSGAPVLSATGEVEGIIVRGDSSYLQTEQCLKPIHCADDQCRGEDVLKGARFVDKIPFETPTPHVVGVDVDDRAGNGNGVPEPGERVRLTLSLKNAGKRTARNVRLTITARGGAARVQGVPTTLPSLAGGATGRVGDLWLEIPAGTRCDQDLTLDVTAAFDGGAWASSFTLPLGRESLRRYATKADVTLPDYAPGGQDFTVGVDAVPAGRRVLFGVDIAHEKPKQLIITVKAPDGTTGVLYKNGLPRTQYPTPASPETVNGLYGADLEPFNDIDQFRAVTARGEWRITVADVGRGAAATIRQVAVVFADRVCQAP